MDTVRADPVRHGLLYAGTETGVWVSFDDGDHWQSLQLNLPHTSMRDLAVHGDDLIVATHGRSFWILDDISPLRQASADTAVAAPHLYRPALAYRVRRDTNTDTPLPPDEPAGRNPPDGAIIDYVLPPPSGARAVSLEILDARGNLVRRYASADTPALTDAKIAAQVIPSYWIRRFRSLPASAGMHRWVWDLRYAAPRSAEHSYPIAAVVHDTPRLPSGPLALPGRYTVRLTVDGRVSTAPLVVKMDPRVTATPAALARQLWLARRLAAMMSSSAATLTQARAAAAALTKLSGEARGALGKSVASLSAKIAALTDGSAGAAPAQPLPTLHQVDGDINALYADVTGVDAGPTTAQRQAAATLALEFAGLKKRWQGIARADVPALNLELDAAKLPGVQPEVRGVREEPQSDVE